MERGDLAVAGLSVPGLLTLTSVVLALASPAGGTAPGASAATPPDPTAAATATPSPGPGPVPGEISPPTTSRGSAGPPARALSPLSPDALDRPDGARPEPSSQPWLPIYTAPLNVRPRAPADPSCDTPPCAAAGPTGPVAPFGRGPRLAPDRPDPRTLRAVRIELLVGTVWRSRTTEPLILASVEAGRLQGLSGAFHLGVIVAPDRDTIAATDIPIGGGFVARRRFGERPIYGSVGVSAGLLIHHASTDLGVVRRVDPDLQVPLRFAWTPGRVGLSLALVQGYSFRSRTYERRGIEVWSRIPYRIGLTLGLHFDVGVRPAKPARAATRRRAP